MDHFDYKKYLKEGRINKDFSQLDEKKEDSKKGNKEEKNALKVLLEKIETTNSTSIKMKMTKEKNQLNYKRTLKKKMVKVKKATRTNKNVLRVLLEMLKTTRKILTKTLKLMRKNQLNLKKTLKEMQSKKMSKLVNQHQQQEQVLPLYLVEQQLQLKSQINLKQVIQEKEEKKLLMYQHNQVKELLTDILKEKIKK